MDDFKISDHNENIVNFDFKALHRFDGYDAKPCSPCRFDL